MSVNIDRVNEEIEALEAILMDEITIKYNDRGQPEQITTVIFPSTAHDTNKQYVCVTLDVILLPNYPDIEPLIRLRNPRGLDDSTLYVISKSIKDKCAEYVGQPVIFELIELIRENLTQSNLPTCHCVICLYGFCEGDSFIKTSCFHYFHSYCLAEHISITERHFKEEQDKLPTWQRQTTGFQPLCPVCREAITCDIDELKNAPPPNELENAQCFEVSTELKVLQAKMKDLYVYQKSKGGIIDEDSENNKLLLITEPFDRSSVSNEEFAGPSLTQATQNCKEKRQKNCISGQQKKIGQKTNSNDTDSVLDTRYEIN